MKRLVLNIAKFIILKAEFKFDYFEIKKNV